MATNLPWSVKGIDADTREAARDAARRAGMSVSDWLEHVIREEARRAPPEPATRQSSVSDIQSRLQRLDLDGLGQSGSRSAMERGSAAMERSAATRPAANRRDDLDALLNHAAQLETRTRSTETKTTSAIESIVGWIEKAESRMAAAERAAAERQERATSVIADAIKTVSSRVSDVERRAREPLQAQPARQQGERAAPAARPGILSRETLANAISDIQVRQRELDRASSRHQPAMAGHGMLHHAARDHEDREGQRDREGLEERRSGERRADVTPLMNSIRADLAQLRAEIAGLSGVPASSKLEDSIRELGQRLDQRHAQSPMDELARPLARIEAELGKLQSLDPTDRFGRIETEIQRLGGRIEDLASSNHEPRLLAAAVQELTGLKDALSRNSAAPRIEDLSGQIAALAQDISRVRDEMSRSSPTGDVENAIEDMRASLMRETREANGIGHGLLQRIMHQLDLVATTVQTVPQSAMGESDRAQLSLLSQKLDHLAQRTHPESEELARSIEALAVKLDDLSDRGSDDLAQRVERLSAQIDHLAARGPAAIEKQIDMLAARIEALAKAQQPVVTPPAPPPVDLTPIEDMIGNLAKRLEDASRPDSSSRSLQSLESQIAALAQRLDAKPAPSPASDGLEHTLQDLMRYLGGLREETTTAVDRAARAAVADAISHVSRPSSDGSLSQLRDDLAGLKDVHVSIDKRTHSALGAVNDTLEQIVQRLAQLEDDISRERSQETDMSARLRVMSMAAADDRPAARDADAPATAPSRRRDDDIGHDFAARSAPQATQAASAPAAGDRLAAAREAARQVRPSESSEASSATLRAARHHDDAILEPEPDLPLEPGSGRPHGRAGASMGTASHGALNPNLIAAARRAAMAASAETQALEADGRKSGKGKAGRTSFPLSLRETLEKRRKPILLGLAAVVLAIGAGQIASSLLTDAPTPAQLLSSADPDAARKASSPVPEQRTQPAAAEASPPAQPVTTAAPPAKDQTSMSRPQAQEPAHAAAQVTGSVAQVTGSVAQVTGSVAAAPVDVAALSPASAPPPASNVGNERFSAQPGRVTDLGDLPSTIGTAGLRRAALEGDANAVYELAVRVSDGAGSARDPKLALRLFERAAAAGSAPAQFRLANIFEKGIGAPRDAKLAMTWYKRAAEKGNAKAMHNLAVLMAEGADGRPDYAAAASLFRQAAEYGVRDSQFNLAILLGRGLGLEQDMTQSYIWFAVAARQGDNDAAKKRDEVGARLTPVDLAAGRSASLSWKAKTADPAANEVSAPPDGWDPQPKPAKSTARQRVS